MLAFLDAWKHRKQETQRLQAALEWALCGQFEFPAFRYEHDPDMYDVRKGELLSPFGARKHRRLVKQETQRRRLVLQKAMRDLVELDKFLEGVVAEPETSVTEPDVQAVCGVSGVSHSVAISAKAASGTAGGLGDGRRPRCRLSHVYWV